LCLYIFYYLLVGIYEYEVSDYVCMEKKKFRMLNTSKKEITTHADLQITEVIKRGGRPKKSDKEKLNAIVSLNTNQHERNILESEANSIGLNVVSLVRMSLSNALKRDFAIASIRSKNDSNNKNNGKVIKQYAIPVTKETKEQLENRAMEYMISVSDLLKMSLRMNGYFNI